MVSCNFGVLQRHVVPRIWSGDLLCRRLAVKFPCSWVSCPKSSLACELSEHHDRQPHDAPRITTFRQSTGRRGTFELLILIYSNQLLTLDSLVPIQNECVPAKQQSIPTPKTRILTTKQPREPHLSESATTSLTFCADVAVSAPPDPHRTREGRLSTRRHPTLVLHRAWRPKADFMYRSPFPPRSEAHLLLVRIPSCQGQRMYVQPELLRDDYKSNRGNRAHTNIPQTTGPRRPSAARPPVPVAAVTSRPLPASSRTDSSLVSQRTPADQPRPSKCLKSTEHCRSEFGSLNGMLYLPHE